MDYLAVAAQADSSDPHSDMTMWLTNIAATATLPQPLNVWKQCKKTRKHSFGSHVTKCWDESGGRGFSGREMEELKSRLTGAIATRREALPAR